MLPDKRTTDKSIPKNLRARGAVSETELLDLYMRRKGLICIAQNGDLGLTPIEGVVRGKPV